MPRKEARPSLGDGITLVCTAIGRFRRSYVHQNSTGTLSGRTERHLLRKQGIRAYPRIAKAVHSEELKQALQTHVEQTQKQVERLDRVFEILEKRAGGKTCEAMKGLIEEASESLEEVEPGPVLDVAIIAAAQRIEHYEIAAYGTVATLADAMGEEEIKTLLGEILEEEKQTDELLTTVSKQVNAEALNQADEDANEADEDEDEESKSQRPRRPPQKELKQRSKPTSRARRP